MTTLEKTSLVNHRKRLDRLLADYRHVKRSALEVKVVLAQAKTHYQYAIQAQQLIQVTAEAVQQQAHGQVAAIVTRCLRAVFGEGAYEFKIEFRQARGKTEAWLLLVRNGIEVDAVDAAGGGVVDVVSFALRLACLMLSVPRRRRLLILDEPFRHLSANYIPAARQLLERLSEEFAVQIILVTHRRGLVCGDIIELS